jgi:hypothetical protein
VGTFSSAALDYLDTQYGLTDKLAVAIDAYCKDLSKKHEEIIKSFGSVPHELERSLIWRMYTKVFYCSLLTFLPLGISTGALVKREILYHRSRYDSA